MGLPIIQSFWAGPRLSVMEQLSIRSFLSHGHPFHLYTCGHVENAPDGTVVRAAEEIIPSAAGLRDCGAAETEVPALSAGFRFAVLHERGGWWTDLDNVCIRPLEFHDEHLFGFEREPDGRRRVGVGLMKAPAGSPLMQESLLLCQQLERTLRSAAGDVGRHALAEALERVPAPVRIVEPSAFCPIDFWRVWQFIGERLLPERCSTIRLWSAKWRRERLNPDAVYDLECIYEQLKRRFGVASPAGSGHGPGWKSIAKIRIRKFQSVQRRRPPILRAA
jgi:hypothetical protein